MSYSTRKCDAGSPPLKKKTLINIPCNIPGEEQNWAIQPVNISSSYGVQIQGYECFNPNLEQAKNDRWMVFFCPNAAAAEEMFDKLNNGYDLEAHVLLVNYRGVNGSGGLMGSLTLTKQTLLDDVAAAMNHLENKAGIKEIIYSGWSLGGGLVNAMWERHTPKEHIKYVGIIDRSFSSLSKTAKLLVPFPFIDWIICLIGWEISAKKGCLRAMEKTAGQIIVYHPDDPIIQDPAQLQHIFKDFRCFENAVKINALDLLVWHYHTNSHIDPWNQDLRNEVKTQALALLEKFKAQDLNTSSS